MNKHLLSKTAALFIISFSSFSVYAFESYVYDVTGHLTSVTYDDGSSISYLYDANGNRLSSIISNNQPPVATDDSATTVFETAVDINVLANDVATNGSLDPTSVTIFTNATNGATNVNPTTGVVTFTPNVSFSGADFFTYTVNDSNGGTSNIATVSITVETEVNQAPVANNDSATTRFETVVLVDILANDTDVDGTVDTTTVVIVVNTTNGATNIDATTGAVTYAPNTGFSGVDSFTYTVNDDQSSTSNVATVSITVDAEPANQAPMATNDTSTTNFNTAVVIAVLTNDSDADGTINVATVTIGTIPQNGTTVVAANGQITYTPTIGFSGADSFTYTVMDDNGASSNEATVSVTVNAAPAPAPTNSGGGGSFGFVSLLMLGFGLRRHKVQ